MKHLFLAAALLLSAAAVFSQERPRYFDNFDTARGVQVDRGLAPKAVAGGRRTSTNATVRSSSTLKLPSASIRTSPVPVSDGTYKKLVRKTAQVTMTVYEGLANLEVVTPRAQPVVSPAMAMEAGKHLKGYSTGDGLVDAFIVDSSRRYNVDPLLIYAQMGQESSFKKRALSHKGASGLMQLMPATARRLGVTNIYDPKQNIEGGVKYMRILLNMFAGDVRLALAGYNAGEGAVIKYGYQIPPYNETQDYVRRISARYQAMSGRR